MYDHVAYVSGPLRVIGGEYGPFTPYQLQRHIRIAEHWAIVAWRAGWAVICPHLNTLFFDGCGVSSDQIIKGDVAMIERLWPRRDALIMCQGWEQSEGSMVEHDAGQGRGVYVVCVESFRCNDELVTGYLRALIDGEDEAKEYADRVLTGTVV